MKKVQLFDQNHALSPLQKCQFCLHFQSMFMRRLQGVSRGDGGLQGVTGGYKGLHGVTKGYKGLQGVTGVCKGLQGVTRGDRWLQGVTEEIERCRRNRALR